MHQLHARALYWIAKLVDHDAGHAGHAPQLEFHARSLAVTHLDDAACTLGRKCRHDSIGRTRRFEAATRALPTGTSAISNRPCASVRVARRATGSAGPINTIRAPGSAPPDAAVTRPRIVPDGPDVTPAFSVGPALKTIVPGPT
jgi:hypothetical protein